MVLSVVIPVFNEEEALPRLLAEVRSMLDPLPSEDRGSDGEVATGASDPPVTRSEVIVVDDGSTDGTGALLDRMAAAWPALRVLHHSVRWGQSAALCSGFALARGDLIATLDGDGQSDPADIPHLLAALESFDMATGVRERRHDAFVRRASSRVAFVVRNAVLHDGIVDTGCSTRVFRRRCLRFLPLQYRGMHRFLPALFQIGGFRVKQVPVRHRPRLGGRPKYGIGNRMIPALLDLFVVRWMKSRYAPGQAPDRSGGDGRTED